MLPEPINTAGRSLCDGTEGGDETISNRIIGTKIESTGFISYAVISKRQETDKIKSTSKSVCMLAL